MHIYAYMFINIHIFICTCMYMYIYINIHTHAHTHLVPVHIYPYPHPPTREERCTVVELVKEGWALLNSRYFEMWLSSTSLYNKKWAHPAAKGFFDIALCLLRIPTTWRAQGCLYMWYVHVYLVGCSYTNRALLRKRLINLGILLAVFTQYTSLFLFFWSGGNPM